MKYPALSLTRLCRKSVHGSTGSPRTHHGTLEINCLAVRPEWVEGRVANCDKLSTGRGEISICFVVLFRGR
jgi:hypothetical protein